MTSWVLLSFGSLPIQLASFYANVVGETVTLQWCTTSEMNNYGFHIQAKAPGTYRIEFDGAKVASGVYICRMTAGESAQARTMLLLK